MSKTGPICCFCIVCATLVAKYVNERLKMKNLIAFLFLILSTNLYAQNVFSVIKVSKELKTIEMIRTTLVPAQYSDIAYAAMSMQSENVYINYINGFAVLEAPVVQEEATPMEISGGYNYLQRVSKEMRNCEGWNKINSSDGYNGVHIITKATLQELYKKREKTDNNLTYEDFLRNAPSAFHPFHNNKNFSFIFHNSHRQLYLYDKYGIKAILEDYFNKINMINKQYNLPEYTEEFIDHSLLEAELWAVSYGLRW